MAESPVGTDLPEPKPALAKRVRLPRLSGKASAAWLVVCFAVTAALIPMAFALPRWIQAELVLAFWWAIWLAVLARLLYTGQRVTDDHQMHEPRNWFAADSAKKAADGSGWGDFLFWGIDGEGCMILLGLVLLVIGIWVLFEVAIPLLLFLSYCVTRGMLAQVVNDRHHCHGRGGRALGWGLVWATAYTVPLAAAVWFVHYVYQQSS